jgi:hypothetical protein
MSEIAMHSPGEKPDGPFNARTMLLVTAIGILAFIAMLALGAYAPDLRSGRNGGTHALSNAATGFSGLVRLAEATGRNPVIVRSEAELQSEDLAVITPDHGWTDLGHILDRRGPRATLIVLPKWQTLADQQRSGWVRVVGLLPPGDPGRMLAPATPLKIARQKRHGEPLLEVGLAAAADVHFLAPAVTQTMSSNQLQPLITTSDGRVVLARVGGRSLYILSDPDLINNHGMGDERQARAALALLDFLNSTDADSILFDVTTNGLGRSRSPLRLAFDAPFLAVTLTIFVAMLLAAWQALVRFGPVRRPERAIAFGKAALVDNSAALIRKAGREAHLGSRYVEVIRERAIALFRIPPSPDPLTLNARLEALNENRSFAAAAEAAASATSRDELLGAAKSLNEWIKEVQQ